MEVFAEFNFFKYINCLYCYNYTRKTSRLKKEIVLTKLNLKASNVYNYAFFKSVF